MPFRDRSRPGIWRGQIQFKGKRHRADFKTFQEAQEWEVETRRELKAGKVPSVPEPPPMETETVTGLADFCNRYLDYAKMRFARKTYEEKKSVCLRLLEKTGNIPVSGVTPVMAHDFLTERAKAVSANAANRDRKNLLAMWIWGKRMYGLEGNPIAPLERLPHDRSPQYTPTTQDVLKVLAAATREERVFLNAYLQTGARRSEIFRWTWADDINFERREVRLGTRKTRDGSMDYEWLPMSEELYKDLWWWWQNRPIKDTPYVFVSTCNRHHGKPFTTRRAFMNGLCKRANVRPFGFHALRRYVASVLADTHKVSAKTIQRILRHKNLGTTEKYIHNINRDLAGVMNLLGTEQVFPRCSQNEVLEPNKG